MPAWCTFTDAARAEQVKAEADALAAEIVTLRPQDPRYQASPLTVIGAHDPATVAQMRNCMSVGNAVAGVICADGHLGYAQPVGGVIAYEKQISISGVGFDIGCGNMAVRLDTPFSAIEDRLGAIIRDVQAVISFGMGRKNNERNLDESQMAYRRLPDVLAHHDASVRVLHTLRPFAVAMAGDAAFDPFKD